MGNTQIPNPEVREQIMREAPRSSRRSVVEKNRSSASDEILRVIQAVTSGNLHERAHTAGFEDKDWELLNTFNGMMNALVAPISTAASYIERLGRGELPEKIDTTYAGEMEALRLGLNALIDGSHAIHEVNAVLTLIAVNDHTRKVEGKYQGVFAEIAEAVNDTRKRLVHLGELSESVAKGDFLNALEELKRIGRRSANDKLIPTYVAMMEAIKGLVDQMNAMSAAHNAGDIDALIPEDKFNGIYRTMATGVNDMVAGHIAVKKKAMACVAEFGRGNFEAELEKFPGKKAFINDNIERLRGNVKSFIAEMTRMSDAHNAGDVDVVIPEEKFEGVYRTMAKGVNDLAAGQIAVMTETVNCVAEFGRGNFEAKLEKFPGKVALINETIEQVRAHLKALIADADMLATAAVQGRLDTRADASRHEGDFRKIVAGVNATLDAVIGPLQEVKHALGSLSDGDFTASIQKEFAGDFNQLKEALNAMAAQVRVALVKIGKETATLASASEQLGRVSQQMSASAEETAAQANVVSAASEQVSTNIQTVATGADEMGASIKEIAKNTADATKIANNAVQLSKTTNETVRKLGASSAEIGQVIKVITSIAQQTNLLALNATIEAARAGEAGKGFAVVANEVKELAKQTAKATEDISQKIQAIQQDTGGAVTAIGQITEVIGQINDIQNTVASAIEEQSVTTNEISRNLAEAAKGGADITMNITSVAQVAKTTTEAAAETQSSAKSLEQLAAQLRELVGQFKYEEGRATAHA